MKNKYQSLSKEAQKEARLKFYTTDTGKSIQIRTNRLLLYSVLLLTFGVYFLISAFISEFSIFDLIYAIGLIIMAFIFFIGRIKIINKQVNDYLINNKKKKK